MNDLSIKVTVSLANAVLLYWLWRRIFRGGGKTILGMVWFSVALISIFSFGTSNIVLWASLVVAVIFEIWRYFSATKYSKATAVFETNQILRGLSPAEAAYFIGLNGHDVFVVAVLNLLDKGMLKVDISSTNLALYLGDEYASGGSSLLPGERKTLRANSAKRNDQIIHPYEDVLLELIRSNKGIPFAEIDSNIWYQFLKNQMNKLAGVYDFSETADYARKVVGKMTAPASAYSAGKRNLSGWRAIQLLDVGKNPFNEHRPEWLFPDDDFQSIVFKLRDSV